MRERERKRETKLTREIETGRDGESWIEKKLYCKVGKDRERERDCYYYIPHFPTLQR